MSFDTKKAVESWKKAKPLLLNNTGVTEVLQSLPPNPGATQLPAYVTVGKKLETFMANPKIKAEKKALACIKTIHDDIDKYLTDTKRDRAAVLRSMQQISSAVRAYHASLEKGPLTPDLVGNYMNLIRGLSLHVRADTPAVLPRTLFLTWDFAESHVQRTFDAMHATMLDAQSAKPKLDTKAVMDKDIVEFKRHCDTLDQVIKAVIAL